VNSTRRSNHDRQSNLFGDQPARDTGPRRAADLGATVKPLFIPLKGEFYDQFAKGQKDTEYRPYGPRWNEDTCPVGREVVLSRGYGKAHRLRGTVTHFTLSKVITQTRLWRSIYGTKHHRAACIQIRLAPSIGGEQT
jgi:hypothetical protein